jgi:tyrosyl-DNA phosphodiesterase-1
MRAGYGCMHIKLMILWFSKHVRIVIGSANLVGYDWDTLENVIFVQDFPIQEHSMSSAKSNFYDDLQDLLTEMGAPHQVKSALDSYDFSRAKVDVAI